MVQRKIGVNSDVQDIKHGIFHYSIIPFLLQDVISWMLHGDQLEGVDLEINTSKSHHSSALALA